MILKSLKNYFVNLKYIFTPLGVLALGAIIGLSILVPGVISAVNELIDSVVELTNGVEINLTAFGNSVWSAGAALDWSDPSAAIDVMLSETWLIDTFNGAIHALVPNGEEYAVQITEAVVQAVAVISVYAIVLVVWLVIGAIGGFLLTKLLVRREIAKRALWKYFLVALADGTLTVAVTWLTVWLATLWTPSIIISILLAFVLCSVVALFEAYMVHGFKKVAYKEIVNIKNVALLWLSNLIIFAVTCALAAIDFVIFNAVVGFFIAVPLIEISVMVISLNAEAYVKAAATAAQARPQPSVLPDIAQPEAAAMTEAADCKIAR